MFTCTYNHLITVSSRTCKFFVFPSNIWLGCGWTPLTPFFQLHLRLTVPPTPISAWLKFSPLTEMCPSQISSLSTFTLAFIWFENWKSAFCWCTWLKSWDPYWKEKLPGPVCVNKPFLSSHIRFLALTPLNSLVRLSVTWSAIANASGSSSTRSFLSVYKLPTINCMELSASFFSLKVPSQFKGYYSISSPPNSEHVVKCMVDSQYSLNSFNYECMDITQVLLAFVLSYWPQVQRQLQRLEHLYSSFSCHLLFRVEQDWKIMINKYIHYSVWELDDLSIENQEKYIRK